MKISEAIAQLRSIKENQYDDETLVRWLSDVEGRIYEEVIKWHEDTDDIAHGPYSPDGDMDTALMVPNPYDDLYIKYLMAQVDYHNAELARYNNSMVMYNIALSDFANWYNRSHRPKQTHYYTGLRY